MDKQLVDILIGAGLVLAFVVIGLLLNGLFGLRRDLQRTLQSLDRNLVPFGQSEVGRLVNFGLHTGRSYVDQPTDPLIASLTGVLQGLQLVKRSGLDLAPEDISGLLVKVVDGFIELTDGKSTNPPA